MKNLFQNFVCILTVLLFWTAFAVMPVFSQEKPKTPLRRIAPDITKMVKDKSAEEIAGLLRELNDKPIPVDETDVVNEFKKKKGTMLVGLADALFNTDPPPELTEQAYLMKLNGLGLFMQLNSDDTGRIVGLKKELEKDGRFPNIVVQCDAYLYVKTIRKTLTSKRVSEKDFRKTAEELTPLVIQYPDTPYFAAAGILLSAAEAYEGSKNLDGFADQFRDNFVKVFRESGNEKLESVAKKLEIDAQQDVVPGKRLRITGTTVSGQPFDIKMLRGKIVLIDFWATWCGPCRGEIPNMKEMYAKYHQRGFEIVGISIDKQVPALQTFLETEKIPWISVSNTMTVANGLPDIANQYGIHGIPTMYLLDRNGRVISTNARGGELKRLLEQGFK